MQVIVHVEHVIRRKPKWTEIFDKQEVYFDVYKK